MIGIDIGIFMGGIVVVEGVFGWPGIGQLAWQAIQRVDIPIIMGVTLVSAFAIVLGNLARRPRGPPDRPAHPHPTEPNRRDKNEEASRVHRPCSPPSRPPRPRRRPSTRRATPGGNITITYKDDVATLDPAIGYDWQNWSMIKSLFDGLMDYEPGTTDAAPGSGGKLRHLRRRHDVHLPPAPRASSSTTAAR